MFEKLTKIVNDFASEFDSIKNKYDDEIIVINRDYAKDGTIWIDKVKNAKDSFEATRNAIRTSYKEQAKPILDEVRAKIDAIATPDVDANVLGMIELLRSTKVSQAELDAYMNKYFNNYLVVKALKEIGQKNNLQVDKVLVLDDYMEILAEASNDCETVFNRYTGLHKSYMCDLVLSGHRFDSYEQQFKSVLKLIEE